MITGYEICTITIPNPDPLNNHTNGSEVQRKPLKDEGEKIHNEDIKGNDGKFTFFMAKNWNIIRM